MWLVVSHLHNYSKLVFDLIHLFNLISHLAHSPQAAPAPSCPAEQGSTQLPLEHTSLLPHCSSLEQPDSQVLWSRVRLVT